MSGLAAPADPETTTSAARTTAAICTLAAPSPSQVSLFQPLSSAPPRSFSPSLSPSAPRRCSSPRSPLRTYSSPSRSPASPLTNALPARRSSLLFPPPPLSTPLHRFRPPSPPPLPSPSPSSLSLLLSSLQAPPALSYPPFRSQ